MAKPDSLWCWVQKCGFTIWLIGSGLLGTRQRVSFAQKKCIVYRIQCTSWQFEHIYSSRLHTLRQMCSLVNIPGSGAYILGLIFVKNGIEMRITVSL
jgi:hypothetical protein